MKKVTSPQSQERQIKGRLIPSDHIIEHRIGSVATRPLKLAFLINEMTSKSQLFKYFEYNSNVWGGFYNPMIPTDGKSLQSDWCELLLAHSPDKIIVCCEISGDLTQEIYQRVQPYCLWQWNEEAVGGEKIGRDIFGSIPLYYQLLHIHEKSRPISKSNFRIVRVDEDSPYSACAAAQFGLVREPYEGMYLKGLQAQVVDCNVNDVGDYLRLLTELEKKLTPLKTTRRGLSPVIDTSEMGFTIVLTGENPAADLCLFWSLRMRPSLGRMWAVVLPASAFKRKGAVQALAEWCNETVIGTNYIVLASATINKQQLLSFKKKLTPYLRSGIEHVDLWFAGFRINPLRVFETESREELTFEDKRFRMKIPEPSFTGEIRNGEWVVDVRLGEGSRRTSSFLPPTYPSLSTLLSGNPPDWIVRSAGLSVRMATNHISYLVKEGQEFLTGTVPSDDEVFNSLFDSKSYRVTQTDKCRYARGVTSLLGGLPELKIWRSSGVRNLFYQMRNGTSSYTPKEMMGWLKPGEAIGHAFSMVSDLALKKVFLRGYKLQCPTCDLTRWYAVADLAEEMPCAGCLTSLQPPVETPFRYRLNDLVARGLDQGTMSLMLTVLFLEGLAEGSFMYVPGLEVFQTQKSDVDIVASCDGHLILAECKDLREGVSHQTIKDIIEQLGTLIEVARDVGAEMVFLSLLQPTAPAELRRRVALLNKKWKKSIAVHLLSGVDLEQGVRMKSMGEFLSPENPSKETEAVLRDFLPNLPSREIGWVKEPGGRSISF